MASKLLNLLAISSLAILACSFGSVNALTTGHSVANRHHAIHDGLVAKKRKRQSQRCIERSSSAAPSSTWAPDPSTAAPPPPPPTSSYAPPPPPPAPSSSAAPAPSPAPGGGKVGIAWSGGDPNNLHFYKTDAVKYLYTWSVYKPDQAAGLNFDYWAQLWGESQVDDFEKLVVPGYASTIIGFNEPDISAQSNLDPGYAAQLWQQHIQPKGYQGFQLISPPTSSGASGKTWMTNFVSACTGCWWNGCGIHWYGKDPEQLKSYITDWHNTFNNCPIHVLEYADMDFVNTEVQDDLSTAFGFYANVDPWMDQTPYVASYFAFGVLTAMDGVNQNDALMGSDGSPTPLGWMYVNDHYTN